MAPHPMTFHNGTASHTQPASSTPTAVPDNNGSKQSPILFFVALGFGLVFTSLWVIVGIKYCCCGSRRRGGFIPSVRDIDVRRLGPGGKKESDKLSGDEVDTMFPVIKYGEHVVETPDPKVPNPTTDSPAARKSVDVADVAAASEQPSAGQPSGDVIITIDAADDDRKDDDVDVNGVGSGPAIHPDFKSDDPLAGQNNCAICIEDFEAGSDVRVLSCKHVYHDTCIVPWLTTRRAVCPLCKVDLSIKAQGKAKKVVSDSADDVPVASTETPAAAESAVSALSPPAPAHTHETDSTLVLELNDMSRSPSLSASSLHAVANARA